MPSLPPPAYLAFRAGSAAARALPAPAIPAVCSLAGKVGARCLPSRRLMVERNLRRALGGDVSPDEVARRVDATFASYVRYWVESFRLPGTAATDIDAGINIVTMEHIDAGLAAGKGVVLALPHLGGWEWAAFWLAEVLGYPVSAVVEKLEPPELAEWFVGLRQSFGMEVITLDAGAAAACARALKQNRVLCLLCDRDLGGGGVEVEMFGERTTLPGGPATLALRSGAPLIPAAVYHDADGRHLGVAGPPLDTTRQGRLREDVARITQDLAHTLEDLIRRAPDQWHLLQPNWPSDHEALAAAGLD